MNGRRVFDVSPHLYEPCDYGRWKGNWYGVPPGKPDLLANFGDGANHHKVNEHEDGTITVSPSILVGDLRPVGEDGRIPSGGAWHGYLERGVWRTC